MKLVWLVVTVSILSACAPDRKVVRIVNGQPGSPGAPGRDGTNGVSCTVLRTEGGSLLLCQDGTEVYVADGRDGTDGSNGQDGEDGSNGTDGQDGSDGNDGIDGEPGEDGSDGATATIVDYSAVSCTNIAGTSVYVKKNGSNFKLYTTSTCSSSSAFAEVSQGEAYWAATRVLATWSSSAARVIFF